MKFRFVQEQFIQSFQSSFKSYDVDHWYAHILQTVLSVKSRCNLDSGNFLRVSKIALAIPKFPSGFQSQLGLLWWHDEPISPAFFLLQNTPLKHRVKCLYRSIMMVFILLTHQNCCKMIVMFCLWLGKWCNPKISSTNFPQIVFNHLLGRLHDGAHCNFSCSTKFSCKGGLNNKRICSSSRSTKTQFLSPNGRWSRLSVCAC
jgi:hypothetical protein